MAKRRVNVPKAVREQVLAEYRHRCAICGADSPHLHHIDEDPSNNDPQNLLPLCPNHHLRDQHNPTAAVAIGRLSLFRRHKDPAILLPQFEPLYKRYCFLTDADILNVPFEDLSAKATDLVAFVRTLKMGEYYAGIIAQLFPQSRRSIYPSDEPKHVLAQRDAKWRRKYAERLRSSQGEVEELVVELLRYQDWLEGGGHATNGV